MDDDICGQGSSGVSESAREDVGQELSGIYRARRLPMGSIVRLEDGCVGMIASLSEGAARPSQRQAPLPPYSIFLPLMMPDAQSPKPEKLDPDALVQRLYIPT